MTKAELTAENRPACRSVDEVIGEIGRRATYEYQGCVEILVVFLDIVRIVLGRLPLVHRVKVNARIVHLHGLEERSESILEAGSGQWAAAWMRARDRAYHFGSIWSGGDGDSFSPPSLFSPSSISCMCFEVEDFKGGWVLVLRAGGRQMALTTPE